MDLFSGSGERIQSEIEATLSANSPFSLALTLTQNRCSTVSIRCSGNHVRLRLDRAFLKAPDSVIAALRECVRRRSRSAWRIVKAYADTIRPAPASVSSIALSSNGSTHNLAEIGDRINRRYFNGKLKCRIGWSRFGASRRRHPRSRSIRFGSYLRSQNVVRINPILDDARVPVEFMEYIVFHEMLHAVVPSHVGDGRWSHHHPQFRALERRFPGVSRMRLLSDELVKTLPRRVAVARGSRGA